MRLYEVILILVHHNVESRQKDLTKRLDAVFSKHKAEISGRHDRGKQLLGYPMKKHSEGHIYVYDVNCDPQAVALLIHDLRRDEELLQVIFTHPIKKPTLTPKKEMASSGR